MERFKQILVINFFIVGSLVITAVPAEAIIGRDDVDPAAYLLPEDAYPAVFDFFDGGGV